MESLNREINYNEIKIRIEASQVSELTKEIALAIIEIKQMYEGKIPPIFSLDIE